MAGNKSNKRKGPGKAPGLKPNIPSLLVGKIRNGKIHMPSSGLHDLSVAFSLKDNGRGHDALKAYTDKCMVGVPDWANLKMLPRRSSPNWPTVHRILQDYDDSVRDDPNDDSNRRAKIHSNDLEPEDWKKLTVNEMYARLAWHMEMESDAALARRGDNEKDKKLEREPTLLEVFRKPDGNNVTVEDKREVFFRLIEFCGRGFNEGGIYRSATNARARAVKIAISEWKALAELEDNYRPDGVGGRQIKLTIEYNGKSKIWDVDEIPVPETHEEFLEQIVEIWEIDEGRTTIEKLILKEPDGAEIPIAEDDDMKHVRTSDSASMEIRIIHTRLELAPGAEPDDPHDPFYIPNEAYGRRCRGEDGVLFPRSREFKMRLLKFLKQLQIGSEDSDDGDPLAAPLPIEVYAESEASDRRQMDFLSGQNAAVRENWRLSEPDARFTDMSSVIQELEGLLTLEPTDEDPNPQPSKLAKEMPTPNTLGDPNADRDPKQLKPAQLSSALWMLVRKSGIIADAPGLGKTIMMAANLLQANFLAKKKGNPFTKPTLVVVPSSLVKKTEEELTHLLGRDARVFRFGKQHNPLFMLDKGKCREPVYFREGNWAFRPNGTSNPANHVIVISCEHLSRLGHSEFDGKLTHFDRIYFDEGHMFRYANLTVRGNIISKFIVRRKYVLTGTFLVNSAADFRGYVGLLEFPAYHNTSDMNIDPPTVNQGQRKESITVDKRHVHTKITTKMRAALDANPFTEPPPEQGKAGDDVAPFYGVNPYDDPDFGENQSRMQTLAAFNWWVTPHLEEFFNKLNKESFAIAIRRLRMLFKAMVLMRGHETLYTDTDGDEKPMSPESDIAPMETTRKIVRFKAETEQMHYNKAMLVIKNKADEAKANRRARVPGFVNNEDDDDTDEEDESDEEAAKDEKSRSPHVQKVNIATHPMLEAFADRTAAMWWFTRNDTMVDLLHQMRQRNTCDLQNQPEPTNDMEILGQFLFCAPKLRAWLIDALDADLNPVHVRREKVITYVQYPRVAHIANKVLGFCGIDALLLTSKTKPDIRYEQIETMFNNGDQKTHCIAPFSLRMMGINMHKRSALVLCLDQAFNLATMQQAIDRVHRIGATDPQRCIRYLVRGTIMYKIEASLHLKAQAIVAVTSDWVHGKMEESGGAMTDEILNAIGAVAQAALTN